VIDDKIQQVALTIVGHLTSIVRQTHVAQQVYPMVKFS